MWLEKLGRRCGRLAPFLGAALFVLSTPACLITTAPEYKLPDTTPPFLIASGADPDVRTILEVGLTLGEPPIEFKVPVLSEDGGESVKGSLFVDYGVNDSLNRPYADEASRAELAPGTLGDGPRIFEVSWQASNLTPGCHRITLMVSHQFDVSTGCPTELTDSSELTWYVNKCVQGVACNSVALDSCPPIETSCPAVPGADGGSPSGGGS
jgi:hypothetical protein